MTNLSIEKGAEVVNAAKAPAVPHTERQWRLACRAFLADGPATLSLAFVIVVAMASLLAPWLAPYDPNTAGDTVQTFLPVFSPGHWLGTDGQGRDVFSRLIWGGRVSLPIGILPPLVTTVVALVFGITAGFFGERIGNLIMRPMDVLFAFPMVLLAIAVSAVLGPGMMNVMLSMSIVMVPYFTRVVYVETVGVRSRDYIDAARIAGSSTLGILLKEVLPNVLAPVLVYATTAIGAMIVFASGLSFLGLGVQPPISDWGIMSSDGLAVLSTSPLVATIPGVIVVVVALAFNFIGDGIRDALDPRQRTLRRK
ncbi:ABC transporter permease [Caballeronia sp. LZ065]|uniref:ABC transporter permease n=1 Tax=Caballeronia sp. LZ065 TaxID=3038571 RepID=UPI00285C7966|nr:ABC transporter permease [Caballeronia sp. LZ065]MDR5781140.1 ABC transporter permease [Caballeronia sp. LZ065]